MANSHALQIFIRNAQSNAKKLSQNAKKLLCMLAFCSSSLQMICDHLASVGAGAGACAGVSAVD
jgi:hypothetical protein